jgi:predicted transcriptional regulator of viral defense system
LAVKEEIMNWAAVLAQEANRNSILRSDELAARYQIEEIAVRNALRRCESHGLVEHVSNKICVNRLNQQFSPRELVNALRPDSYISLESALVEYGIANQSPKVLTCVTSGYPKTFKTRSFIITFRRISKQRLFGFVKKSTRYNDYYIAEPEKALLDWIYLNRQEGLPTPVDELNLQLLDLKKLQDYAARYPGTVIEIVRQLVIDHSLAA